MKLHFPEESIALDFQSSLRALPGVPACSPISDYFDVTEKLKKKILLRDGSPDSEMLGLLTIGVISSVEFYLRNVFSRIPEVCPIAARHIEMSLVPAGAAGFYSGSGLPQYMSCFEHESLADGKRIRSLCEKFTGLKVVADGSANKVIEDFDKLCEIRHCLVHARGFVGLKACNALGLDDRAPRKVLLQAEGALEVLKLAHNVVRALNRFLAQGIIERWIGSGVLTGSWTEDQDIFKRYMDLFCIPSESDFNGAAFKCYLPYRRAAKARAAAILAKVDGAQ